MRLDLRWMIVAVLATVCAGCWLAVCAGAFLRLKVGIWTAIVTSAAISTEILFWALAGALGVSVLQARRRLSQWVVRAVRRHR